MRDLTKWLMGLASVGIVSITGCVITMLVTMKGIETNLETTMRYMEESSSQCEVEDAEHDRLLADHEGRLKILEIQNEIDDKEDEEEHRKLEELVPAVQGILLIMERNKELD